MENVRGRDRVEAGEACLRKNGRGVDTNRNWAVHWGHKERDYDPEEEFPGDRPFRWECAARVAHIVSSTCAYHSFLPQSGRANAVQQCRAVMSGGRRNVWW